MTGGWPRASAGTRPASDLSSPRQIRALLDAAAQDLARSGVASAAHDAAQLLAVVASVDRRDLWRIERLDGSARARFLDLVRRRAAREPLQHLTGRAYFRHLELAVGPGVFVPRPETEVVAQAAIDEAFAVRLASGAPEAGRDRSPVVVDLCTGSGAIALAVLDEVPAARVFAVEVDPAAFEWARRNAARHPDYGDRLDLRLGEAGVAFPELDGTVDVVVSNPPYIPLDAEPLEPEVRDHDPAVALWSGPDGLDAIGMVARAAARLLRPGGLLVVEHADAQGTAVPELLRADGHWAEVADHPDLTGRPRYATARRSPN